MKMNSVGNLALAVILGTCLGFGQATSGGTQSNPQPGAPGSTEKSKKKVNKSKTTGQAGPQNNTSASPASKVELNPQPLPPGAKVELNPQPLPPRTAPGSNTSPADKVGFNPQPDPPGKQAKTKNATVSPADAHGFNPQPDPPGKQTNQNVNAADKVALNPQPLPPGAVAGANNEASKNKAKSKKGSAGANTGSSTPK